MKFCQFIPPVNRDLWFIPTLGILVTTFYYSSSLGDICHHPSKVADLTTTMTSASSVISLEFEIFGKVQGVFFRKYTVAKGKELGLRGWCRNTSQGSVLGALQGPPDQIVKMKHWLEKEGSPKSRIGRAEFRNEMTIPDYTLSSFDVRK